MPPCLRGRDDAAHNGFIAHSIQSRLPAIITSVLERNLQCTEPDADKKLRALANALSENDFAVVAPACAVDGGPDWSQLCRKLLGQGALDVPWWFLEHYVYRVLLGSLGYYRSLIDPFAAQKAEALEKGMRPFVARCEGLYAGLSCLKRDVFRACLLGSLWGNQADLSLSSGKVVEGAGATCGRLLVDDVTACWDALQPHRGSTAPVVIVLDNCGTELLHDLLFVGALLRMDLRVTLHHKSAPVFVSDATFDDIERHLHALEAWTSEATAGLTSLLRGALKSKRLTLRNGGGFYELPLSLSDLPPALQSEYASAALVVTKGDANYRRLLGDRNWPHDVSFASVVGPHWPSSSDADSPPSQSPLLAIRTCKSPCVVGLEPADEASAAERNPKWLVDGSCGMVQLFLPLRVNSR